MTGPFRIKPIALALASVALFTAPAFAQGNPAGPVRTYQRPTQAPIIGANRVGTVTGVHNDTPHFIVEALYYEAIDESGPNSPGSDEVFAIFESAGQRVSTSQVEDVDTGDRIEFDAAQRCIGPAVDNDGSQNAAWTCDQGGRPGPVQFSINLYERDPHYADIFRPQWCIRTGNTDIGVAECFTRNTDVLFDADFSYETAEILAHLDPNCRCWQQTARYRESDWRGDMEYQVTFRIVRVDVGGDGSAGVATFDDDPVVYRSGNLNVRATQYLELDAGTAVGSGGDFLFTEPSNGNYRLTPAGGAKIWTGGPTARGYATCFAERGSANYVTSFVTLPAVGNYACYVTSDGRVGEMRTASITPSTFGGNDLLVASYITWQ